MIKLDFITRQLAKAQKKRHEHYVVNRIWNLLGDTTIKFITQQFVSRGDARALTDMYFPQLGIHIEVDEGFHKSQIEGDRLREADIINATGHIILRVDVTKDVDEINSEIDKIVFTIKSAKNSSSNFFPWDMDAEMNPKTYIEKGYIDVEDDVAFRVMSDAASCFGRTFNGLQLSYIHHPAEPGKRLWFPKFFENESWSNEISEDEETIRECCKIPGKFQDHVDRVLNENTVSRLVFAKVKGPLGDIMYRFKGEYEVDRQASQLDKGIVHKRIAKRVKTYPAGESATVMEPADVHEHLEIFYESKIRVMPENDRLKLAFFILRDLSL